MGVLAWIHNRGGCDQGDMYGGVDRAATPDVVDLYEEKRPSPLTSQLEVFVQADAAPDGEAVAAAVAEVWDEALGHGPELPLATHIELRARRGLVRLRLEPGFCEPEVLRELLLGTCRVVGIRDRAAETAA